MAEAATTTTTPALPLTNAGVLDRIAGYSRQHPNDFGTPDGRDRIPMKKLMKLFEIKKTTPPETRHLFRAIVNEVCDLEIIEGIGKVLVGKRRTDANADANANEAGGASSDAGAVGANATASGTSDSNGTSNSNSNSNGTSNSNSNEHGAVASTSTTANKNENENVVVNDRVVCDSGNDNTIGTIGNTNSNDTTTTTTNDNNNNNNDNDNEDDYPEKLGYKAAAPSISTSNNYSCGNYDHDCNGDGATRSFLFQPPHPTDSGNLSIATVDSVGVYTYTDVNGGSGSGNGNHQNGNTHNTCSNATKLERRIGYRRRGSVTRYSMVAQKAIKVIDEYKKHEEIISQFRRDSLKIEQSMMRNLSLGSNGNGNTGANNDSNTNGNTNESSNGGNPNTANSGTNTTDDSGETENNGGTNGDHANADGDADPVHSSDHGASAAGSETARSGTCKNSGASLSSSGGKKRWQGGRTNNTNTNNTTKQQGTGANTNNHPNNGEGNAVQRFFRRGRFSLAF